MPYRYFRVQPARFPQPGLALQRPLEVKGRIEGTNLVQGIVYLLTNEGMPGLVKIGYTTTELVTRIRSLNNTSVPFDFECIYAAKVANCLQTEMLLHQVFADKRVNPRREFFLVEPEQAKAALRLAAVEDVTPRVEETIPDIGERAAVASMAARRRSTSMFDIGLELGTVLALDRDASVTCSVTGPWEVEFQGERLSLSASALKAIRGLGFEWPAANGWAHWTFNGRTLRDMVTDHLDGGAEGEA